METFRGDGTRDDSQRRFLEQPRENELLVQHSVAMLQQGCNNSKQFRNNVATLF